MNKDIALTIGAFGADCYRFLSESQLKDALGAAKTSEYWRTIVADHVITGLFNYQVDACPDEPLVGIVHLRHHAIINGLLKDNCSVDQLSFVIEHHLGALSNITLHKPYSEFAGNTRADEPTLCLDTLKDHLEPYKDWINYLRNLYSQNPIRAAARSAKLGIALDILRIIQSSQEKRVLGNHPTPFERHDITDTSGLVTTLHNAMVALRQEGVIRHSLPPRINWLRLLHRPDLAAACSPEGYYLPIPSPTAFEQIMEMATEPVPAQMYISPDMDKVTRMLLRGGHSVRWGILAHEGFQTILIRDLLNPDRFRIYCVRLDHDMVHSAGELSRKDPEKMADDLMGIINASWVLLSKQDTVLRCSEIQWPALP